VLYRIDCKMVQWTWNRRYDANVLGIRKREYMDMNYIETT